jgi:WhiB family transcriptional regulator, redox-sensing transcriptional regulator
MSDPLAGSVSEALWPIDAACREHPNPELWFPERGQTTERARDICYGCRVRDECLRYAIEHDVDAGIWGGLSPQERRQASSSRYQKRHPSAASHRSSPGPR